MASVTKRKWSHNGANKEAWIVRYRDRGGKQRAKQFEKKREADAYCRKVEHEIDTGTHLAHAVSPTFAQVAAGFLDFQAQRLANGEIGDGRHGEIVMTFRRYILPRLGARKLVDVTPHDLEQWHRDIVADYKLGPRTSRLRLNTISLLYQYAIRRNMAVIDPVPAAVQFLGKKHVPKIRTFKLEEINILLAALERRIPKLEDRGWHHLRCAVYLALFCGLRAGEIRGLTVKHVDFENGLLRIRHSLTPYNVLKGPKTESGVRDVAMPAKLAEMLQEQIVRFTVPSPEGIVFTTSKGTAIRRADLQHMKWLPLLRWAGLLKEGESGLHFHALRHFMISYMIEQRTPIAEVSRMVGHRTPQITLGVYTHNISDTIRSAPVNDMAGALLTRSTGGFSAQEVHTG